MSQMMRNHIFPRGLVGAVAVFVLASSCADEGSQSAAPDGAQVDSLFSEYAEGRSPGAAVMVIQDGLVVHSKGYGLADLGSEESLSATTPVRLGSLSKAFTAMAIVLLAERGDLSYDDPVTRWVPELARFSGITVRHLLNHTSGLPDYYENSPLEEAATAPNRDTYFANGEAITIYESWGDPLFAPGERYEYSNPGYEALALLVERITGMPFGRFLNDNLFAPLGMSTAVLRDRPEQIIPGRAIGYAPESTSGTWKEDDDHWGNWMVGAGGIYASLEDLQRWDQALWDWDLEGDRLDEVFAPAVLNGGTTSPYGFGWGVSEHLGYPAVSHTGGWVGFRNAIVRFTEPRLTVIVLTNSTGSAMELLDSVAALYLDQ